MSEADSGATAVAWRTLNDFGYWYITQDKAVADTLRDIEKKDVQPLYLIPDKAAERIRELEETLEATVKAIENGNMYEKSEERNRLRFALIKSRTVLSRKDER